jgi:hypothetical protein
MAYNQQASVRSQFPIFDRLFNALSLAISEDYNVPPDSLQSRKTVHQRIAIFARQAQPAFWVALAFSILIPLVQISLHLLAKSGLFFGTSLQPNRAIGILFKREDALSYTSWAYQAKLGNFAFEDLFTTDPHSAIFFNLYFLVVGGICRIADLTPVRLMGLLSLLLGPVAAFTVLLITRELKFSKLAQSFGIVFVFCGAGLSGIFKLLLILGVEKLFAFTWLSELLHPGADAYYADLFPLMALVLYPYHATAFAILALTVLVAIKLLNARMDIVPVKLATLLGALSFVLGFVRPYEAVTLFLIFNLSLLARFVVYRDVHRRSALAVLYIFNFCALPPLAYSIFVTTQPVWSGFSRRSVGLTGDAQFFLKGFVILWGLAGVGLIFAIKDRNKRLSFVAIWAVLSAVLLSLSPSYGTKLAGCSIVADGLLAAYGIGRLMETSKTVATSRAVWWLSVGSVGVMVLTPLWVFSSVIRHGAPQVDTDLLAAGSWIRKLEGVHIPVVLTSSDSGLVLAGVFGERVYAGHWSLTPGSDVKKAKLKKAGLEEDVSGDTKNYDRDLFEELVRDTKPDYILLRKSSPASSIVAACARSGLAYRGDRWFAVDASDWSCP